MIAVVDPIPRPTTEPTSQDPEYANPDEFPSFDEVDSDTVALPEDSFDAASADFATEGDGE